MNLSYLIVLGLSGLIFMTTAQAVPAKERDAAFVAPRNKGNFDPQSLPVRAEPTQVDIGETNLGVARNASLFFVNSGTEKVEIKSVDLHKDGNIKATIISDDCTKNGSLPPDGRCVMVLEIIPTNGGPWTAEVLMHHTGPSRFARGEVLGNTLSSKASDIPGLAPSSVSISPIDFGDVEVNIGKAVRTALMINGGQDPLVIESIDLVASDHDLARLESGCKVKQELKSGQSCPITLVWQPSNRGNVSTDLIIQHTGQPSFVVMPVRGKSAGASDDRSSSSGSDRDKSSGRDDTSLTLPSKSGTAGPLSMPISTVSEVADHIPAISSSHIDLPPADIELIGIISQQAIIRTPQGQVQVVGRGGEFNLDGRNYRVTDVGKDKALVMTNGKNLELFLRSAVGKGGESSKSYPSDQSSSSTSSSNTVTKSSKK